MVSREFFGAQHSLYELTSWRRESVEGAGERDVEAELWLPGSLWEAAPEGRGCGGSPAASGGLPPWEQTPSIPQHGNRGGEGEVWGEATRIIT